MDGNGSGIRMSSLEFRRSGLHKRLAADDDAEVVRKLRASWPVGTPCHLAPVPGVVVAGRLGYVVEITDREHVTIRDPWGRTWTGEPSCLMAVDTSGAFWHVIRDDPGRRAI